MNRHLDRHLDAPLAPTIAPPIAPPIDRPLDRVLGRRGVLALLATPVLAAVLQACSVGGDAGDRGHRGEEDGGGDERLAGEARSSAVRVAATPADAAAAVDAVNRFGMDLYRLLAGATTGNLVISPASIATALAMVSAGARGTTLDEMAATLRMADPSTAHRGMNALSAELADRNTDDVTVSIANSLWAQSGMPIETPFLDVLAAEYGAGLHLVDYRADPDAARERINDWVEEATAGRIPELLADGTITADARLTVVNAVHLEAPWAQTFDPEATREGAFTTSGGDLVQAPMMHLTETLPFASGDGWQAVELDYAGGQLAMLVFLPEEGFLADFEQIFLVTDATQYLAPAAVSLTMPRFDIGTATPLADVLAALGMRQVFTDAADLTAITTAEPLKIAHVVHQADITVDEHGTEAAAATAVVAEATGAAPEEPEPIEVRCDHPFVFALRDKPTGTILFLGRVGEPAAPAG